jgi:hypothetical protein
MHSVQCMASPEWNFEGAYRHAFFERPAREKTDKTDKTPVSSVLSVPNA